MLTLALLAATDRTVILSADLAVEADTLTGMELMLPVHESTVKLDDEAGVTVDVEDDTVAADAGDCDGSAAEDDACDGAAEGAGDQSTDDGATDNVDVGISEEIFDSDCVAEAATGRDTMFLPSMKTTDSDVTVLLLLCAEFITLVPVEGACLMQTAGPTGSFVMPICLDIPK